MVSLIAVAYMMEVGRNYLAVLIYVSFFLNIGKIFYYKVRAT